MPSLRELQRSFAEGVFSGDGASPEALQVCDLIVADSFSSLSRLQIYRNNMYSSLREALKAVYPVIVRLVGEGFFKYAAHNYIRRYPSRSGNLHAFGGRFASFLREFPPAGELLYLPDVARLEWAWHQAFHAAEHSGLSLDRLRYVTPERYGELRFKLHPASRLLTSSFPILRIWEVNQAGFEGEESVDLDSGGDRLLVIREDLRVVIHRLSDGEFVLLDALSQDTPFAAACETALEAERELDVTACLQKHVLNTTLVDFDL